MMQGTKKESFLTILVPILAAVLGLVAGAMVMLIGGYDPFTGYSALLDGMIGSPKAIGETIRAMTPLILAGIAVAFAFKAGLFNIGVEGQLLVGWMASVWVGYAMDLPKFIHLPVAIIVAALAGAVWGWIPGFLKARYKVHEVIVTIMMNYIALNGTSWVIKSFLYAGNEKSFDIKATASLASPFLSLITGNSRLHYGIIIAIIAAIIMWFFLNKTTRGYEIRAVGFNQNASEYAGMNVKKNIMLAMAISGAFAGLAGAMEGLGTFQNMSSLSAFTGTGFDGIAVALLGAGHPIGIILAAALFGGLNTAAPAMNFVADVPAELVKIVIAFIIFFVAASYLIRLFLGRFVKEGK